MMETNPKVITAKDLIRPQVVLAPILGAIGRPVVILLDVSVAVDPLSKRSRPKPLFAARHFMLFDVMKPDSDTFIVGSADIILALAA